MYRIIVKRGPKLDWPEEILFRHEYPGTPEEYLKSCCNVKEISVYKSWKKLDLWTYELIPHDNLSFPVPKTLVIMQSMTPLSVDKEDGYKHLLQQERGKRTQLRRELARFLSVAREACKAGDGTVTLERIEWALDLLKKD